jgi:3-isopropylmalate/(R)-2-methylmalate dehydratase large subunit
MSGLTLFEKIWRRHLVRDLGGGVGLIAIDRTLLHERTGGVALRSLREAGRGLADPLQVFATMDHVVDTLPGRTDRTIMPTGTDFIHALREEAGRQDVWLFDVGDPGQGIVHVISPEQAIVLPGLTLVCPDSHTCTQGAMGALAWGIGSSEAEHALATGTLRARKPRTLRIVIDGALPASVTAKDVALHVLHRFGSSVAAGHVVEFAGEAVRAMEIEARLTLCNLATEMAAFTAIVAPDEKTFAYLKGGRFAPGGAGWDLAEAAWRELFTDADAVFDREIMIDAGEIAPMISWGTNPQQSVPLGGAVPGPGELDKPATHARALDYIGLAEGQALSGLPIDAAFIGSCTNSRLSDLRRAARLLEGRKVAQGVRAICVPGSTAVKQLAEAEGLDRVFREAGFEWRESGCSMCFFAGGEAMPAGSRVVSSTNRNFESRQGPGTRTHIASPEVVAASAIAGRIATPQELA